MLRDYSPPLVPQVFVCKFIEDMKKRFPEIDVLEVMHDGVRAKVHFAEIFKEPNDAQKESRKQDGRK
jgi:hypothetical protein